ncbi:hypothetical protein D3C81_1127850 [compost metagenome]
MTFTFIDLTSPFSLYCRPFSFNDLNLLERAKIVTSSPASMNFIAYMLPITPAPKIKILSCFTNIKTTPTYS